MQLNRIKSITGSIRKKNTLKNYEFLFTRFSDEFSDRELESITPDEILSFLTPLLLSQSIFQLHPQHHRF